MVVGRLVRVGFIVGRLFPRISVGTTVLVVGTTVRDASGPGLVVVFTMGDTTGLVVGTTVGDAPWFVVGTSVRDSSVLVEGTIVRDATGIRVGLSGTIGATVGMTVASDDVAADGMKVSPATGGNVRAIEGASEERSVSPAAGQRSAFGRTCSVFVGRPRS